MGIYADIQADVGDAFDTDLADAVHAAVLTRKTSVYDPTTGKPVITTETHDTRCTVEPVSHEAVDGEVTKIGDYTLLILHSELTEIPAIADSVQIDGKAYEVNSVTKDSATAAWTLTARIL